MAKKSWFSNVKIKKKAKAEKAVTEPVTKEVPNTTPVVEENEIIEPEKPVTVVEEMDLSDVKVIGMKKSQVKREIVGNWTSTMYQAPKWRIKFEAQVAPIPMFLLPIHIQKYLLSKWFGTNIWKKDKEWLEKHNVDMKIVEDLKKFISERN